ncbi:MAG: hypothetical protein ACRBBK_00100 [Paracoccaceae bacterium]
MSRSRDIAALVRVEQPVTGPVTQLTADINYTPAALASDPDWAADRLEAISETLSDLETLFCSGFCAIAPLGQPAPGVSFRASLIADHTIRIEMQHPIGLGNEGLIVLIRLIHALHDTPAESFAMLVEALGSEEEARAVWGGMVFAEMVSGIEVHLRCGTGATRCDLPIAPFESFVEAARIRALAPKVLPELDPDLEDAFLGLSGLGAFVTSRENPTYAIGEEEFFLRDAGDTSEIVIDAISIEAPYLIAYLGVISGGVPLQIRVEE